MTSSVLIGLVRRHEEQVRADRARRLGDAAHRVLVDDELGRRRAGGGRGAGLLPPLAAAVVDLREQPEEGRAQPSARRRPGSSPCGRAWRGRSPRAMPSRRPSASRRADVERARSGCIGARGTRGRSTTRMLFTRSMRGEVGLLGALEERASRASRCCPWCGAGGCTRSRSRLSSSASFLAPLEQPGEAALLALIDREVAVERALDVPHLVEERLVARRRRAPAAACTSGWFLPLPPLSERRRARACAST